MNSKKYSKRKRRMELVKIGKELNTLLQSDIDYIMDLSNSDDDVERRMVSARQRV